MPDNNIAYLEFDKSGTGTCDSIVERTPEGTTQVIYKIRDDFQSLASSGGMMGDEFCHSNAIHYLPEQDAYYVSVLNQNMIIKVNRTSKSLEWVLDGDGNEVAGLNYISGVSWSRQHGHHPLPDGSLYIFNNGEGGFGGSGSSLALHFSINGNSASEIWSYNGGSSSGTLGDVQQASNGNVFVDYSNNGVIHEVTQSGDLVRSITASGFGYLDARRSLYGLPDRF